MANARRTSSVQVHGPALRHVRVSRGKTITALAKAAGVSCSFLAHVERGTKRGVRAAVVWVLVNELALDDSRVLLAEPYSEDVLKIMATWSQSGPSVVPLYSVA